MASLYCFPPIVSPDACVLILGTMPGADSLKQQQYYGHHRNVFWPILFELFHRPFSKDYEDRVQLILDNRLSLWDVLQTCNRPGSLDENISEEEPNDFTGFFQAHPGIHIVCFSSKNAYNLYEKHVGLDAHKQYHVFPSTSPANQTKSYVQKLEEWRKLLELIGGC